MTINHTALLEAAITALANRLSVVPVKTDGSKAPALSSADWNKYAAELPTMDRVIGWFGGDQYDGMGYMTGTVSGELEMLEAEGRAVEEGLWDAFILMCDDHDLGDVLQRIMDGYEETTPSGGIHLLYRVSDGQARGNTKLARRPSTPAELADNPDAKLQVLMETRGQRGFVVVTPSAGRAHPSGGAWEMESGGADSIASITTEERDRLWAVATMLDQMPTQSKPDERKALDGLGSATHGLRPGDDWSAKTDWVDIIGKHGWTQSYRMGDGYAWRKPGKTGPGISATTGQSTDGVDRLYVFSTSTEFDPETPYTKFAAYALLEHGNDYSAAARSLAAAGYGERATVTMPTPGSEFADLIPAKEDTVGVTSTTPPPTVPADFGPSLPPEQQEPQPPVMRPLDSQDGHASLLIAEHHKVIRYVPELDRWMRWEGHLWKPQAKDGGIVYEHAKEVARSLPGGTRDEDKYKRACLSSTGLSAALRLAQTDRLVRIGVDELDSHPWELNTPAGIVDLRTGSLGPSRPGQLHSKSTDYSPDWDADRAVWGRFLDTTFGGDAEMIGWMQRLLGSACVGEVREHILPVLYGQGANGKSVLLETVAYVLADYAITLPARFLVQNGQGVTDASVLLGARLAIASETNEGEAFDEALVKRLTGGDTIRARYMRQDWFQFRPSHTLFLATNHRLEVPSGGGKSFWRRVREVPFNHIVPDDMQDPELAQKLAAEHGPAILAWLADGAAEYARSGLSDPERVKVATAEYAESADQVGVFLDDCCILGMGRERVGDVYAAYLKWCEEQHYKNAAVKSNKAFTEALKRHGIDVHRGGKGIRFYTPVMLEGDETVTSESERFLS